MNAYRTLLAAVVTAVVAGCAGDGGTAPQEDPEALRSPVGTFTLATVNGEKVPMLWDEMEAWKGGPMLRAFWNGGTIQIRADSTFTMTLRHSMTGPNLPGNIQQDTHSGTWRLAPGAWIELRRSDGGVAKLQTTDLIYSLTRTVMVPTLAGGEEQVIFVFVRD